MILASVGLQALYVEVRIGRYRDCEQGFKIRSLSLVELGAEGVH